MKNKTNIILIGLVILLLAAGLYVKKDIEMAIGNISQTLKEFEKLTKGKDNNFLNIMGKLEQKKVNRKTSEEYKQERITKTNTLLTKLGINFRFKTNDANTQKNNKNNLFSPFNKVLNGLDGKY